MYRLSDLVVADTINLLINSSNLLPKNANDQKIIPLLALNSENFLNFIKKIVKMKWIYLLLTIPFTRLDLKLVIL